MTAENKLFDLEYQNVYQGKKWGIGKILGVFGIICLAMIIRDIGMLFVYSSIYENVALEGVATSISFWTYGIATVLFLLPLVLPVVLVLTKGAYYDEPQAPLLPSFGKVGNIIMIVALVLVFIVPVSVMLMGMFSTAYLFVAVNMFLVFATNVAVFYYFGTYILQRAKASATLKYVLPTVFMVVTNVIAIAATFGASKLLPAVGVELQVVTSFNEYIQDKVLIDLLLPAIFALAAVAIGLVSAGFLYHFTQNIIYAVVPTYVLAYPVVVVFQRIKESAATIAKLEKSISNSSNKTKIAEWTAEMTNEQTATVICYVVVGLLFACSIALGVYALVGMIKNLKEEN